MLCKEIIMVLLANKMRIFLAFSVLNSSQMGILRPEIPKKQIKESISN